MKNARIVFAESDFYRRIVETEKRITIAAFNAALQCTVSM
jgi:hypothetical protein